MRKIKRGNGLTDLIAEQYEEIELAGKEPAEFSKNFLLEEYRFYLRMLNKR